MAAAANIYIYMLVILTEIYDEFVDKYCFVYIGMQKSKRYFTIVYSLLIFLHKSSNRVRNDTGQTYIVDF